MNLITQNNQTTVEEREAKVRALLASAYPDAEPSPALRARVAQHAQQYAATTEKAVSSSRWFAFAAPRRVGLSAVAALGVALLVTTTALYPRWSAAKSLQKIQAAMLDVTNVHATYFEVGQADTPDRNVETWENGVNVRVENRQPSATGKGSLLDSELITDGKQYHFYPAQNRVTVRRHEPRFQSSGFTIAAMRSDYLRWGWKDTIRDLGMTMWDGRVARQVSIERDEPAGPTQFLLLVDPATDLPFRYEFKIKLRGSDQWETRITGDCEYNAALPADFFTPNYPGAVVFDQDAAQQRFRARLAKGIAEETIAGGRRIVIRDVQANRDGTIFVLYTAGKRPGDSFQCDNRFAGRDWQTELTDNQGNAYIPYDQQVILFGNDKENAARGLVYNGHRLEAEVWVPKRPLEAQDSSRRITLTIHANPINLHGNGWEKVEYTETAKFTLPIQQTADTLTPDFGPLTTIGLDEKAVAKLQADVRGELPPGVHPSPELIGELVGGNGSVQSLTFAPDGKTLVGRWPDGSRLWDVASRQIRTFPLFQPSGLNATFAPDGSRLAMMNRVYDEKKRRYTHVEMQMFDLRTNRKLWSVPFNGDGLGVPVFSPDGQTLTAVGTHIDQTEKGPDGQVYATLMTGRVKRWDANTGAEKGVIAVGESLFNLALTPTQDKLITLLNIKEAQKANKSRFYEVIGTQAKVWNAQTGSLIRSLPVPEGMVLGVVTTSPDGSLIAAGGGEKKNGNTIGGVVLIWNANTGELVQTLRGRSSVGNIAISPDNRLLLGTGGQDEKSIETWNLRTGKQGETLIGHGAVVLNIAFSPDGSKFVSGDLKGRILLWQTPAAP